MRSLIRSTSLLVLTLAATAAPQDRRSGPRATWIELGLDASIGWTADPEVFVDGRRPKRNIALDVDRTGMIDAAIQQADEQHRLVLWYVPRIVEGQNRGVQMYRAPVLDLYAMQVLFNDPDVAALVNSRFVPVRVVCDEALSARFGLRPLDFVEPAVVLLDGDGEVVHFVERFRTFHAQWFVEMLRRALEAGGAEGDVASAEGAAGALAQGRYALAEQRVTAMPIGDADRHYVAAMLHRRRGETEAALRALQLAREAGGMPPADLAAEQLLIQTLAGQQVAVDRALPVDGTRAAEAAYLSALAILRAGDEAAAEARFRAIATRWPDDMFGRRAAANVERGPDDRPLGAAFSGFERIRYLEPWAYADLFGDTAWHGPALTADQLAAHAVQHLLELQRADGGFKDSRYAYWPTPRITPNAWIAITALAASALLEHRQVDPEHIAPATIDAAIARAEAYMFDPDHLNRGDNEDVYADTYRLLYLARKHGTASAEERAALVERMNTVIRAAQARQAESGFWAHEYANAFCTGAMLWGLRLAEGAGADVPPEMFSRGVAALIAARTDEGGFAYGGTAARRSSSVKDSSTRMPLCEGMLFELGHSDPQRLRAAFDAYWGHIDRIERVRRNDFHSDGELAGFFFFHALFHASEMNRLLPEELSAEGRRRFLALLQRIPEMDGSFLDSHEIGRSYGTAMALLTLANVADE